MKRYFILLAVFFLSISAAIAQEWAISGDEGYKENGVDIIVGHFRATKNGAVITSDRAESAGGIVRVLGNVVLSKDGTKMYASEMVINQNTDIAEVLSNTGIVRIISKDGTTLRSPFVTYDLKAEIFYFRGGGVIMSNDSVLEGERGSYHEKEGIAVINDNVQVFDKDFQAIADSVHYSKPQDLTSAFGNIVFWHKDGILKAKKGSYQKAAKTFRLFENSYALSKENQAWADSIVYNKEKELLYLGRNICILDTANHGALLGDYAFVDRTREYTFLTKNAAAATFQPREDTIFLRADTLMAYNLRNRASLAKDSLIRFVKALDSVRFFRKDMQGACDSIVYNTLDSVAYMYGMPILWNENSQITADSINIYTKNQRVDRAEMILNSFIAQHDTITYYNQIKGRSMTAYFNDENKISHVDVKGNGQTIYFVKDSTSVEGVNKALSSNISIYLEEGKVDRMVFKVNPESNMFPIGKIDETELKLKGFSWRPENRPTSRFNITNKVVMPSIANEVNAIKRPTFPIYEKIYRKKLDTNAANH